MIGQQAPTRLQSRITSIVLFGFTRPRHESCKGCPYTTEAVQRIKVFRSLDSFSSKSAGEPPGGCITDFANFGLLCRNRVFRQAGTPGHVRRTCIQREILSTRLLTGFQEADKGADHPEKSFQVIWPQMTRLSAMTTREDWRALVATINKVSIVSICTNFIV